jgi:hypothetical protein
MLVIIIITLLTAWTDVFVADRVAGGWNGGRGGCPAHER